METARLVLLSFLIAACGIGSGGGGAGEPEQACLDLLSALASAAFVCGQDYQSTYDRHLRDIAGGSCANVTSIRDRTSLRTCLTSIKTLPCPDLLADKLDPSCQMQLQRPN